MANQCSDEPTHNSFATSAYRIMTGVKRLDKRRNMTVLTSVTVRGRQPRFVGHMLRNASDVVLETKVLVSRRLEDKQ